METKIRDLLSKMTLEEKIGQMCQISGANASHEALIRRGLVGSFLNVVVTETRNRIQRVAVEESRLGIPLIFGRDVIHGFRTIFPIPLAQAATWNPALVEEAATVAAREASAVGVDWTFAPMVDIARDPRWGRIAEGNGEDPYLGAQMGAAMVRGFQGDDLAASDRIAACAKHYVGYGAAEGGRDYNSTLIPENVLRDTYLIPFQACVDAGAATLMSGFNEINGIPASGNEFTLKKVLREEWGFDGFVVSDWASVAEMIPHGYCEDEKAAAYAGLKAGVDMEMVSECYRKNMASLVAEGKIPLAWVDEAVGNILRVKFRLGLFENPYVDSDRASVLLAPEHLETARKVARESVVLLKNENGILPLSDSIANIAVIGPLANSPTDQLGCWVMDGKAEEVVTPLRAVRERFDVCVQYAPGLKTSRDTDENGFGEAVAAARASDVVLLFLGEEAILSGEAHCRAFLDLPGAQESLVDALAAVGKPMVAIIMAGRPLTLSRLAEKVDVLLYAWHPGTMGGPAIADILSGDESPSGKLPVSFPRAVGQVPLYYNHNNTGRPPKLGGRNIPLGTPLDPLDFVSCYLDVDPTPLFPFGYGLSYARFEYANLHLSAKEIRLGETLTVSADVKNVGDVAAEEVAQLYVRDLVGSRTRPVKELKGFQRVRFAPGESRTLTFALHTDHLAFHTAAMEFIAEPGQFHLWVGGSTDGGLQGTFEITSCEPPSPPAARRSAGAGLPTRRPHPSESVRAGLHCPV